MVKNLPANAGDMGLIPGQGRFHMLWSPCATAIDLMPWSPGVATTEARASRACAPQQGRPPQ